jgi:hypothetical protein
MLSRSTNRALRCGSRTRPCTRTCPRLSRSRGRGCLRSCSTRRGSSSGCRDPWRHRSTRPIRWRRGCIRLGNLKGKMWISEWPVQKSRRRHGKENSQWLHILLRNRLSLQARNDHHQVPIQLCQEHSTKQRHLRT